MKRLAFLFSLCLLSLGTQAKSLVLTLSDGTQMYYQLGGETNPVMRFNQGVMTVETDTYQLSEIKNFSISDSDAPSGIADQPTTLHPHFVANTMVINATDAPQVKVFASGGNEVQADVKKSGDVISINLNALPRGTYIISTGKASVKVMKK